MSATLSDWEVAEHEAPPEEPGAMHATMAELHNRSAQLAAEHAMSAHDETQKVAGTIKEQLREAFDRIEEVTASAHEASMTACEAAARAQEVEVKVSDMMEMQRQMVEAIRTIAQALGPRMAEQAAPVDAGTGDVAPQVVG